MAFWQTTTSDKFGIRVTKLDLISWTEGEQLKLQPFGFPCSECGLMLETEWDFAAHFTVPNPEFKNLGWCPVVGNP